MSILSAAFAAIKSTLHWGPSVEPFHQAVIEEHDALEARVVALESERAADKAMLDQLRDEWSAMFPVRPADAPNYIETPAAVDEPEKAVIDALTAPVPDDAASIVDDTEHSADAAQQNPAEPAIKGVPDLLSLKPDQVSAGPDTDPEPAVVPAAE